MKLSKEFYRQNTLKVAQELLGKKLVHNNNGTILSGIIVETEAYMGPQDKAAHSFGGKKTERTKVMFEPGGISYIYFIYGLYYCFNVVTAKENDPQAVLIRALEPLEGLEDMAMIRYKKNFAELKKREIINLTSGPSKLCSALRLDKTLNGVDLTSGVLYIEKVNYPSFEIVKTTRIGIDYAEEAKEYPWRFYIKDNPYISKK
jgi:DNA-3-methyladenine glycosylase